jgi:hypothetical protein
MDLRTSNSAFHQVLEDPSWCSLKRLDSRAQKKVNYSPCSNTKLQQMLEIVSHLNLKFYWTVYGTYTFLHTDRTHKHSVSSLGFALLANSAGAMCQLPIVRLIVWREKIDGLGNNHFCSLFCFLRSFLYKNLHILMTVDLIKKVLQYTFCSRSNSLTPRY